MLTQHKRVSCSIRPYHKSSEMPRKNTTNSHENGCQNCRMRIFTGTDLIECLMESIHCQWAMSYGYSRILCKHPDAKLQVNSNQP